MHCINQQQLPLWQLITESTFCSPRRRMQHKLQKVNCDAWNMSFRNVTSFSTGLHKFRVSNRLVTSILHNNILKNNHNHNHLHRAVRLIHHRTISRHNLIHRNNHLYKHLHLIRR